MTGLIFSSAFCSLATELAVELLSRSAEDWALRVLPILSDQIRAGLFEEFREMSADELLQEAKRRAQKSGF